MKLVRIAVFAALAACGSEGPQPTRAFPSQPYATFTTESGGYGVEIRSAPTQPPVRGELQLQLRVTDPHGAGVDGLALDVQPWMPSHDHGTSVVPTVSPLGDGAYLVDHVALFMPGAWQLHVAMTRDGLSDRVTAAIDVQ